MPLFQIDIEKRLDSEFWTNRYVVDTADLNEAAVVAGRIVDREEAIHNDLITFTQARVRDFDPTTDVFINLPLGTTGERNVLGAPIPLFNVARVDFGVITGRPSRKYLRIGLTEADITGQNIVTDLLNLIDTAYAQPMLSEVAFVDVDGQDIVNAVVFAPISMRQLRRGSRRRTQPVLR